MGGWWSFVGAWVGVGRTILAEFKQGGMKDSWGCHSLFMSQAASQRNGPLSSARVQCHSRLQQCALAQKLQSHPIPPHPTPTFDPSQPQGWASRQLLPTFFSPVRDICARISGLSHASSSSGRIPSRPRATCAWAGKICKNPQPHAG